MTGYTLALVKAVRRAPKHKIGVRLGRACIAANISVSQVAKDFKVTRPTVYAWFTGKSNPNWRQELAIEQYIKKLA
jgi:transcriptional regulator with XRE-family HTH domain